MCSKLKHAQRSHKTYARRMAAARWYCNYSTTKEERQQEKLFWQMMMNGGANAVKEINKNET